jgi:DNA-binding transcriptional LysR family regulator
VNSTHDPTSPEQLSRVDLNLLVAFDALAHERSVTRAALRLGVTQSAMSHALRRLRDLLGDPLLVRGKRGMALTPRAESLVVPLRSGLVTLGRALVQPGRFDPASARRAFCVASPDLFDVLVIPRLLERVRREAPGIDVTIVPIAERGLHERLETGDVDVAIVPQVELPSTGAEVAPGGLVRSRLFRDRFVCFLRADHPAIRRKRALSLATFTSLSHALVSPGGGGPGLVDQVLGEQGLSRRIALRLPHFYSALAIVADSDLVLTAPEGLARLIGRELPVVALPAPLKLPRHSIHMVWHERFSREAGHRWLRELVAAVSRSLGFDS